MHDTSYWRNAEGDIMKLEQDALGCQSKYKLIHPNLLIFVDKVGSNTSQTKDGKVGGELNLCTKNGRPKQCAATKDAHFTVLGFTSADGETLMCLIIFAAKALRMNGLWALTLL
jgi:hypothetical protein